MKKGTKISPWTELEDILVLRGDKSVAELSEEIHRSVPAIQMRRSNLRKKLGLQMQSRTPWSDADDAAILELYGQCSRSQVATYLGRTDKSVASRLSYLRDNGASIPRRPNGASLVPFLIPASGILCAKTCVQCGKLRNAAYFLHPSSKRTKSFPAKCKVCLRQASSERYQRNRKAVLGAQRALQRATVESATKSGSPYTGEDLEKISDTENSDIELAVSLGRTYYAIRNQRAKLVPQDRKGKTLSDSFWNIEFPNALKALQQHFKDLGKPVPEELWEWNDTEEMAS